MQFKGSPPHGHGEDSDGLNGDEMIYVGDIDEIIELNDGQDEFVYENNEEEEMEDEINQEEEEEEEEEDSRKIDDNALIHFDKHTGSVFCGSMTNDGTVAVTGGEDDVAYVWNSETGQVIHKCNGHKDSVIFAEFNYDNRYLATGDMSGIIQVWKTLDYSIVWHFNMGDATWMKWHNQANVLFAASHGGEIYMWKIPESDCKVFQGYGTRSENGKLTPDGKKIISGYEDGSIRVLDLKEGTILLTIPANTAHSGTITDIDCHPDGKMIISAAVDGKTVASTITNGKIIGILQNLQENMHETDDCSDNVVRDWVEAVAFCQNAQLHMVATGSVSGQIFIWDTSKNVIRHKIVQKAGVSKILWKDASPFFFSAGLDGVLRLFDGRTGNCLVSLTGHHQDILDFHISSNGKKILTTSDDESARIFNIPDYAIV